MLQCMTVQRITKIYHLMAEHAAHCIYGADAYHIANNYEYQNGRCVVTTFGELWFVVTHNIL